MSQPPNQPPPNQPPPNQPPPNQPPGNQPPGNQPPGYGQQGAYGAPQQKPSKGLAVAALVLGVVALLLSLTIVLSPFGALVGLVALILGLVASSKAKKGTAGGRAMAVFGWILGLLALLIGGIVAVVVALFFDNAQSYTECVDQAGGNTSEIEQCARDFRDDLENRIGG